MLLKRPAWITCKTSAYMLSVVGEPREVFLSSSQTSPKPCSDVSPTADSFLSGHGMGQLLALSGS